MAAWLHDCMDAWMHEVIGMIGWRPCEAWTNKRLWQKEGSREAMMLGSWGTIFLTDHIAFSLFQHSIIPLFHYSIIPV
jgi:hypothetical protein